MHEHHTHDGIDTLTRPELRVFVEAARAQQPVDTCVTVESVQAGLERRRSRLQSRRSLGLSAALALAAALIAALGVSWWAAQAPHADAPPELAKHDLDLDPAVVLRSTASAEIRGPWTLALGPGTHEIELRQGAARPLTIELPDRRLELVEGRATIEVVGHDAVVRLHVGVAAFIGDDGTRTAIELQPLLDGAATFEHGPEHAPESAAALARAADRQLAAGAREQAIITLRRLIELHPEASQTRTAVLDLGRLLDASGRAHEARCAFELYLERWPNSPVSAEVEARVAKLPRSGQRCRP